jgi:hypothetical protein
MTLKTGASVAALLLGLTVTAALSASRSATETPKVPIAGQNSTQDANMMLAKDLIDLLIEPAPEWVGRSGNRRLTVVAVVRAMPDLSPTSSAVASALVE